MALVSSNPISVTAADLNGDGKPDLAVTNYMSSTVSVRLNNGSGTFAARADYPTDPGPYSVAAADLFRSRAPSSTPADLRQRLQVRVRPPIG